jgi:hypothetical protein
MMTTLRRVRLIQNHLESGSQTNLFLDEDAESDDSDAKPTVKKSVPKHEAEKFKVCLDITYYNPNLT